MRYRLIKKRREKSRKAGNMALYLISAVALIVCLAPIGLFQFHGMLSAFRFLDRIGYWAQFAVLYFGFTSPPLLFLLVILKTVELRAERNAHEDQKKGYLEQKGIEELERSSAIKANEILVDELRRNELSKVFFNLLNSKPILLEKISYNGEDKKYSGKFAIEVHKKDFMQLIEAYRQNREIIDDKIKRYEKGFVSKKIMIGLIEKNLNPVESLESHMKNIYPYIKYLLIIYKTIKTSTASFDLADYIALYFSQIGESELYVIGYYGSRLFHELGIDPYAFFIEAELGTQLVSAIVMNGSDLTKALEWRSMIIEILSSVRNSLANE
jgi:hypothetical protein